MTSSADRWSRAVAKIIAADGMGIEARIVMGRVLAAARGAARKFRPGQLEAISGQTGIGPDQLRRYVRVADIAKHQCCVDSGHTPAGGSSTDGGY